MEAEFSRTLDALRVDRSWASLFTGTIALVLVAAWLVWFFGADLTVHDASMRARVEVTPAPARVAAPTAGRIVRVNLTVGAQVAEGAILVELESTNERIALARARTAVDSLQAEAASVARELTSEDATSVHAASSDREGAREVLARRRAIEAMLALAAEEETRVRGLTEAGVTSEAELSKAVAEHRERRATFEALLHHGGAVDAGNRQRESVRKARREQLDRQQVRLAAELAAARNEVERLENELERRTIRAPIAGTLGEVASLQPGAVIPEGAVVATVVPTGTLHVVAEYGAPSIGRIEPGQRARLRLDGFPWIQYGSVPLEVVRVGSEVRDGTVRVELELRGARIPVHHGMTGIVEIALEQTSPAALLLRAVGRRTAPARM